MKEQVIKVTPFQFLDVQRKMQTSYVFDPWGENFPDVGKVKEILRNLGVEPEPNVTYIFVVK